MEYRLKQDGMIVASANSQREILHYAMVYGQDGPVKIEGRLQGQRWRALDPNRI